MKFSGSIEIHQPIDLVAQLFADSKNLKEYQDGFVKKELQEGEKGQNGAISMMYYKHGKRAMELKETIIANNLPDSFEAFYHHKVMDNTMKCKFISLAEDKTKYEYEIEYTRIDWVMPKLMAILFPSVYRNPVNKWMEQFKQFVEKH